MPAQHPAAFLCADEFARMKILPDENRSSDGKGNKNVISLTVETTDLSRHFLGASEYDLDQDSSNGRGRQRQEGD
jgi:hypothetical protein